MSHGGRGSSYPARATTIKQKKKKGINGMWKVWLRLFELRLAPWLARGLMETSWETFTSAFMAVWVTPSLEWHSSSELDFPGGGDNRNRKKKKIPSGKSHQNRIYSFCRKLSAPPSHFSISWSGPSVVYSATSPRRNSEPRFCGWQTVRFFQFPILNSDWGSFLTVWTVLIWNRINSCPEKVLTWAAGEADAIFAFF